MSGRVVSPLGRIARSCSGALAVIGSIGLLILVGLTVIGVVWRYALNDPIFGLIDVSTMVSAVVVACAVAWAAYKQAHVSIELIEQHFGQDRLRGVGRVIDALTTFVFCAAGYALIRKGACGFDCGDITDNLAIEHSPFYLMLAASMGFCAALSAYKAFGRHHHSSKES